MKAIAVLQKNRPPFTKSHSLVYVRGSGGDGRPAGWAGQQINYSVHLFQARVHLLHQF